MSDRVTTHSLSLAQIVFSSLITSQPAFLSAMFGVCISWAASQPSHKYNLAALMTHVHTSVSVSRSSTLCLSFKLVIYFLRVRLSYSPSAFVSLCVRVSVKVSAFHSGWLFVCLPVFKKQSENKSLQIPKLGFLCACVFISMCLPGQFTLMLLSDWKKSIRAL